MKLLIKLVVSLVLVLVLLIIGVGFLINPAVEKAVSGGLSEATGCESSLGSADIGLLAGEVKFAELAIQNPPGFRDGPLLELGHFNASWDTASLFSEEVRVSELELDGLQLSLELKGKQTNLGPLIERLRELSADGAEESPTGGEEQPEAPGSDKGGGETQLNIERVRIAGVRAELFISDVPGIDGQYAVDVPEFVIENLGNGENSASVTEWSAHILEELLEKVQTAGAGGNFPAEWQALLDGDLDTIKAAAKQELEKQAEKWLDENEDELPADAQKGLDALKKEGVDLDGLFGDK